MASSQSTVQSWMALRDWTRLRVNVADISKLTLTTEGAYIIHRDSLKADAVKTDAVPTPENKETDEAAIERIAARFSILDEMAEAVSTSKVRAMIVIWTSRHW